MKQETLFEKDTLQALIKLIFVSLLEAVVVSNRSK